MVSIEFQIPSVSVNESDGSVIVELVRTGNHTDNITVCINVTMIVDPAIVQRMYKLYITYTSSVPLHYAPQFTIYHHYMSGKGFLSLPSTIISLTYFSTKESSFGQANYHIAHF